jgi:hypothetical protein
MSTKLAFGIGSTAETISLYSYAALVTLYYNQILGMEIWMAGLAPSLAIIACPKKAKPGAVDPDTIWWMGLVDSPMTILPGLIAACFYARYRINRASFEATQASPEGPAETCLIVSTLQDAPTFSARKCEVFWQTNPQELSVDKRCPGRKWFTITHKGIDGRIRVRMPDGNTAEQHQLLGRVHEICNRVRPGRPCLLGAGVETGFLRKQHETLQKHAEV